METEAATAAAGSEAGLALFDRALAAFLRARTQFGSVESRYSVAGHGLCVSFAGPALVPALTPAFDHLTATDASRVRDDLTICVWDGLSPAVAPPPPSWSSTGYLGNSELRGCSGERIQTAFDSYLGMLSMYDAERRLALFWLRDSTHVPITLVGTPFRIILQWWAASFDSQLIHAAAVGSARGGVVIAGASGAGKSTTALASLESGLLFAGDDFVLVRPSPTPQVFSVYNSAKIDQTTLATRFPTLQAAVHDRPRLPEEKEVLFVHRRWPGRVTSGFPLRALLLPTFGRGNDSRLVPVGAADGLRTLLPGILPFPGQRQAATARLARLVRALPTYRFELGQDTAGVSQVLKGFLHDTDTWP